LYAGLSFIAAITIGIGVDDIIHFLNTFRQYRKPGVDVEAAIRLTLQSSGKAIIYTSLALVFGFSVMELSKFRPLILFGMLMGITMVATTIGALLILPSAIKLTNMGLEKKVISKQSLLRIDFLKAPALIKRKEADAKALKTL
jgi:predicted RND superfamily exporter protein